MSRQSGFGFEPGYLFFWPWIMYPYSGEGLEAVQKPGFEQAIRSTQFVSDEKAFAAEAGKLLSRSDSFDEYGGRSTGQSD